jgi:hypothetical protein
MGRDVQRMWLGVSACGLAMQPMQAPILHFARLNHGAASSMPLKVREAFARLYEQFLSIDEPLLSGRVPLFLFRIGVPEVDPVRSLRLPLNQIVHSASFSNLIA